MLNSKFADGTTPTDPLDLLYGAIPLETAEANMKQAEKDLLTAQANYRRSKAIYEAKLKKSYANFEKLMRGME